MVSVDGIVVDDELLMMVDDWDNGSASAGSQSSDNDQIEGTQYGPRE
jgi:hypothetical protein